MTKWGFNSRITFLKNLGKKCRETCISRLNQRNVILEYSRFTCFSLKNIRELHNSRRERLNSRWLNYMRQVLARGRRHFICQASTPLTAPALSSTIALSCEFSLRSRILVESPPWLWLDLSGQLLTASAQNLGLEDLTTATRWHIRRHKDRLSDQMSTPW